MHWFVQKISEVLPFRNILLKTAGEERRGEGTGRRHTRTPPIAQGQASRRNRLVCAGVANYHDLLLNLTLFDASLKDPDPGVR